MMQKDEDQLLEFWFKFHAARLGAENLFIFDNGSTNSQVLATLKKISTAGGNVIWQHNDHESFRNKGLVFLHFMHSLRRRGFRFFIPLDCDEFIAVESENGPSLDWSLISAELERCREFAASQISHCYLNNPDQPRMFRRSAFKKVFGTFKGIDWLGEGFHHVRAPMEPSKICYFHLHHRPYEDFRQKAGAKLIAHGQELTTEALTRFANSNANNHQVARELLLTREEYLKRIERPGYEEHPELADWFDTHAGRQPFQSIE